MKIHINYADGCFQASQKVCGESALANGFGRTIAYGRSDIEPDFIRANPFAFSQARGAGYWLWKPYLILRTLVTLGPEDWLMYTDSGLYFMRDPWPLILSHEMLTREKGILTLGWAGLNREYTKRDAFRLMRMDEPHHANAAQITASYLVCRNTPFARAFLGEWLAYARDPRILTDLPNTQGFPNYPEFKDHRHDQSILSLLCLKHQIPAAADISQWTMPNAPYVIHHRNRD